MRITYLNYSLSTNEHQATYCEIWFWLFERQALGGTFVYPSKVIPDIVLKEKDGLK